MRLDRQPPQATPGRSVSDPRLRQVSDPALPEVEELASLVLEGDGDAAWRLVDSCHQEAASALEVLSKLLSAAARRLDELWENDERSSVEVMLGLCKLRTLALHLVSSASAESEPRLNALTAVTWAPRGDRMVFAPVLHECCLELSGWHVEKYDGLPARDVLNRVKGASVDLVLCALDDVRLLEATCRGLRRFREASSNRAVRILAVGRAFGSCSALADCPLTRIVKTVDETVSFAHAQA